MTGRVHGFRSHPRRRGYGTVELGQLADSSLDTLSVLGRHAVTRFSRHGVCLALAANAF